MTSIRSRRDQRGPGRVIGFAAVIVLALGVFGLPGRARAAAPTSVTSRQTSSMGHPPSAGGRTERWNGLRLGVLAPTGSPFMGTSGTSFTLDGAPFRWIGFNAYGMGASGGGGEVGCYFGLPWTTSELDGYFSRLPVNGMTRVFAFPNDGAGASRSAGFIASEAAQAANLTQITDAAARYRQHIVVVLGDDDGHCGDSEDADAAQGGSGKDEAFYTGGWTDDWSTWVRYVVPRFAANSAVAMWEISNEPGQAGYEPTPAEMRSYLSGTSDLIRSLDANHLISVGGSDAANFGGDAAWQAAMSLANIDAISFHDYSFQYENGNEVSGSFTAAQRIARALQKPFYAGEAGVPTCGPAASACATRAGIQQTEEARARDLITKADDYFAPSGGPAIGGIMFWDAEPSPASWLTVPRFQIFPDDPLISAVAAYRVPRYRPGHPWLWPSVTGLCCLLLALVLVALTVRFRRAGPGRHSSRR